MKNSRPVYSTDSGRLCPECGAALAACTCKKIRAPEGDGVVRLRREVGGRGGKTVTTISGILRDEGELKKIASRLKHVCGTGGTLKNGVIEIQGDHRDKIKNELAQQGFTVKLSGG